MPTPAGIGEMYEDLKDVVDDAVARTVSAHNRDADEAGGEANLLFVQAVRTFDPDRGEIRKRVWSIVWNGLLGRARTYARKNARLARRDADLDARGAEDAVPFDRDGLLTRLGSDGRTAVAMLLDSPAELMAAIMAAPRPGPRAVRTALRDALAGMGWTPRRVTAAFREIRDALHDD